MILALDVAASASSPRKRPTQIALIEPFSDWRIEETERRQREGEQGPADRAGGEVALAGAAAGGPVVLDRRPSLTSFRRKPDP